MDSFIARKLNKIHLKKQLNFERRTSLVYILYSFEMNHVNEVLNRSLNTNGVIRQCARLCRPCWRMLHCEAARGAISAQINKRGRSGTMLMRPRLTSTPNSNCKLSPIFVKSQHKLEGLWLRNNLKVSCRTAATQFRHRTDKMEEKFGGWTGKKATAVFFSVTSQPQSSSSSLIRLLTYVPMLN